MATLNEIRNNLLGVIRGRVTDDEIVPDAQLDFIIGYTRSKLLRESFKKEKTLDSKWIQTIDGLELIQADRSECSSLPTGCIILKSKQEIPFILNFGGKAAVSFIGTLDGNPYELTSEVQVIWSKFKKFTSKVPRVFIRGRFLYVINDQNIEFLRLSAVFADPLELANFTGCNGSQCFTADSEYPMSDEMTSILTQLILEKELRIQAYAPRDTTNNAQSDVKTISQ